MKKELADNLLQRYPEFFDYLLPDQKIHAKSSENLESTFQAVNELLSQESIVMPIQFGFECGDGWYVLLDTLMENIQRYIRNENNRRKNTVKWKFWRNVIFKKASKYSYKYKRLWKLVYWINERLPKGLTLLQPIKITQIKEKYGDLCFYYYGGDDKIDAMVTLTECLSSRTCEFCGATQDVGRTLGWIITICKSCYEENMGNRSWELLEK